MNKEEMKEMLVLVKAKKEFLKIDLLGEYCGKTCCKNCIFYDVCNELMWETRGMLQRAEDILESHINGGTK